MGIALYTVCGSADFLWSEMIEKGCVITDKYFYRGFVSAGSDSFAASAEMKLNMAVGFLGNATNK